MIKSKEELLDIRKSAEEELASYKCRILVCSGTGCIATGSNKIHEIFQEMVDGVDGIKLEFAPHYKDEHAKMGVKKTGCQGFCELGPLVRIQKGDQVVQYVKVQPEDCREIFEQTILGDTVMQRLLYSKGDTHYTSPDEIPFIAKQTRIVLENCGKVDAESLDEYLAAGGFRALEKAMFEMTRDEVIDEVDKSGLRGRGGGGFPCGRKWKQVARQKETVRYVVCNGDEGDPYSVIEAMAIAGYAIGADEGNVYIRAEFPLAIERLSLAIAQTRKLGLLGKNILGTDFSFDIHIKYGAGAFVCGEETALISSIEGNRGEPVVKPPFPAEQGLFGKPTIVNNVETLANIPVIFLDGAESFAKLGTEKSKGTKVFALAGKINNVGLVEVPMGTTLREVIYDIGGGIKDGKEFKAAQTGGPSGGCITKENLDTPIDFDNLNAIGSMMGSGGLIVMDEDNCMVDIAKFYLEFTVEESCGKCTPCRIGNKRLLEILEKITQGEATMKDLEKLEDLSNIIKDTALCGLGQSAPNPVLSTLKYFKDEYIAHVERKICPAKVCRALARYEIENEKCVGCGNCARNCPVNAIYKTDIPAKNPKLFLYKINPEECIRCGSCQPKCPVKAIKL